ncbi:MAG TPA: hypothetical protein VG186_12230 [Solirubrobacteraceae bacterium]|nr:hypothetical protein [Solirubrobacteraceae bacterium]
MTGACHTYATRRAVLLAMSLLAACVTVGVAAIAADGQTRVTRISLSGRIGPLRLDSSTRTDITGRLGPPDYSSSGNIGLAPTLTPKYELLGYQCTQQSSFTTCAINYYLNARRHRLESFSTTSSAFALPGGIHVGTPAEQAVRIEHKPDLGGCRQGITVRTPRLTAFIWTSGGRFKSTKHAIEVIGGQVSQISIDYRRYGVGANGVNFCV